VLVAMRHRVLWRHLEGEHLVLLLVVARIVLRVVPHLLRVWALGWEATVLSKHLLRMHWVSLVLELLLVELVWDLLLVALHWLSILGCRVEGHWLL